ncbi:MULTISPECIES: ferric iron uptake transcriptional regulator [Saccharibacillus]|uniref:Transcriptional repressor n=1 Tax=Saccharibacillus brassicae TaxID=2583377 RepID=A0A4Y6V1Q5_SACBS|nr:MULTISPECIES: transcriptional repressor [Saccharibacillus]QDH22738.1 transcriptional repressor [Saccharibacillus brassicae]
MISVEEQLKSMKQQMMAKGYKSTVQREATMRVLLEHERDHMSAEDVYMRVKERFPEIGLATVYRTLELLTELHLVEKMNFGDGVARFDLRSKDHEHMHHHMICSICGEVEEIKDDWLTELEQRVKREYGFNVSDHRLDFIGTFSSCKHGDCRRHCETAS